jgi:hypothetical protein
LADIDAYLLGAMQPYAVGPAEPSEPA